MSIKHIGWFLILIFIMMLATCRAVENVKVGISAPDFFAQAVQGRSYHLEEDLRSQTILLSFVDTMGKVDLTTPDLSRSQIVFLKSMQEQYGAKGLVVLIVDAAYTKTGKYTGRDELINFTYSWNLKDIPILDDPKGLIAKAYGVKSTPTTFLIDSQRIVRQRWDGYASAAQLALSIESLVGAPSYRQNDENDVTPYASNCLNEAPPLARFSGVGLARSFSNELWVIDSGQPWGVGTAFPLQWLFIDTHNIAKEEPIRIRVIGSYTAFQQTILLIDQPMELLPADIARSLVLGEPILPAIYSLVTTILLEQPGCLQVQALITSEQTHSILYRSGTIIIASK